MANEWLYVASPGGEFYATLNEDKVWKLNEDGEWDPQLGSLVQYTKFMPELRDLTREETQRLPKPPSIHAKR